MRNLIDVESAFLEKSQQIFWFPQNKTKNKQKEKKKTLFLAQIIGTLCWQLSLSFFAYVLLGQSCKLHVFCTATTDTIH